MEISAHELNEIQAKASFTDNVLNAVIQATFDDLQSAVETFQELHMTMCFLDQQLTNRAVSLQDVHETVRECLDRVSNLEAKSNVISVGGDSNN